LYAFLISSMCATCQPTYVLDLITLIIFVQSSLCSLPATSSL
jgi:hypothetical protein